MPIWLCQESCGRWERGDSGGIEWTQEGKPNAEHSR